MVVFDQYQDIMFITGMAASGKTTLTKHYCKSIDRLIAVDPCWNLGDIGYIVHYPERIAPAFNQFRKVIYQPEYQDKIHDTQAFDEIKKLSNFTLIIDEVDSYAAPRWYICDSLKSIIRKGRNTGKGIICNTRRPHNIHNDIRSNPSFVICFTLPEETDYKYMAKWLSIEPEKIQHLAWHWSFVYTVKERKLELKEPLF